MVILIPHIFSSSLSHSDAGVRALLQRGPEKQLVVQRPAGGPVWIHGPAV